LVQTRVPSTISERHCSVLIRDRFERPQMQKLNSAFAHDAADQARNCHIINFD
jgi:hypothetical protein